jgi:hypothetical protein
VRLSLTLLPRSGGEGGEHRRCEPVGGDSGPHGLRGWLRSQDAPHPPPLPATRFARVGRGVAAATLCWLALSPPARAYGNRAARSATPPLAARRGCAIMLLRGLRRSPRSRLQAQAPSSSFPGETYACFELFHFSS